MLSLIDCLDFIDLDSATIEIIAEHQNMATIVAAELGNQLIADLRGIHVLHEMHQDLIARAAERQDLAREKELRKVTTPSSASIRCRGNSSVRLPAAPVPKAPLGFERAFRSLWSGCRPGRPDLPQSSPRGPLWQS